uniref:Uncharacterized protein n=1 Tax=Panagrolaimus superbus TaxID=310955 RepID=A0A914YJ44_9BILA
MIKRCKYFFVKNPVLIIHDLDYQDIDMNKLSSKLWITNELFVSPETVSNDCVASLIVPKIYRCDVKRLNLYNLIISLNELIFICSSVKELHLHRVTVKNDNGTLVAFEELLEKLSYVEGIHYTFTTPSNNTSKTTFKEL